jgi:1,2-diacylglycerol 3-alpha-glucosyltransferase
MRIGILNLSMLKSYKKGFYNEQDIGLAKAFDQYADEVKVYKLIPINQNSVTERINECKNLTVQFLPSKGIGINGKINTAKLDETLDMLICHSDTQIDVPKVYRWASKNKVAFIPYIGVTESHNTNKIKKIIIDMVFKHNTYFYRKSHCLAKTPAVENKLRQYGVKNITVAPVGLDFSLLKADYDNYSKAELKKKYGYGENDKVILFIGRLTDEKQPLRMINIFSELAKRNSDYKLIIVGSGELKNSVKIKIREARLENKVQMFDSIQNSQIWELYRIAEAFVNLNQHEIFGMAILEAMYYECKVVAWHAPGPDFIIKDKETGYLADSEKQIVELIAGSKDVGDASHRQIIREFTWNNMAEKVLKNLDKIGRY